MRVPAKLRPSGAAKRPPPSVIDSGSRASGPAMALSSNATSATQRPMGPATGSGDQLAVSSGTRPGAGRSPTTLQKAAGLRSEPPTSLPSARGTMPQASATAAPPLLPPQVRSRAYGFRVAPKMVLNVCDPAPNSGVFVLPTVTAPAARARCTTIASRSGMLSRKNGDPRVVRMPAVSKRSLCAIGSPCRGPSGAPRACASSARAASARARSATRVTIALTRGFTRSIRLRCASSTSRAERSPIPDEPDQVHRGAKAEFGGLAGSVCGVRCRRTRTARIARA